MKLQGRRKGRTRACNGWGREGGERERAAALGTGVPRMADVSILVNRSVCVCDKVVQYFLYLLIPVSSGCFFSILC